VNNYIKKDMSTKFSIVKQLNSFKYAINGLKILFFEEHNSRIHLALMFLAIVCGLFFKISIGEWLILIILFAIVFSAELFNSAIENICNMISMEQHETIGKIKDLSAAAVLVCSLVAFIIGCLIFIPKFFNLIYR
jgi:diacylglycerol kinase